MPDHTPDRECYRCRRRGTRRFIRDTQGWRCTSRACLYRQEHARA